MDLTKIMELSKISVAEVEKLANGNLILEEALLHLFKETLGLIALSGLPWEAKEFPEILRIMANVLDVINDEARKK